ncbi:MAG: hypothetical protein AB9880_08905 [Christensenellales bacterium]
MTRVDAAVGPWEKPGGSDETLMRAPAAGERITQKDMTMRNRGENSPIRHSMRQLIRYLMRSRLARPCGSGGDPRACGALAAALARAEGSSRNNPQALYAPGWYIRGC